MDVKAIHIGKLIKVLWKQQGISLERVCKFLQCTEEEIKWMLEQKSMDTDKLLRWSKLLEYDFFRIYSQHLILFAPKAANKAESKQKPEKNDDQTTPLFRKNIYTREIINHLLELIKTGQKTRHQVITEYKIPKTTLYRWIQKYTTGENERKTGFLQDIPGNRTKK